jgi:hypothetical protein
MIKLVAIQRAFQDLTDKVEIKDNQAILVPSLHTAAALVLTTVATVLAFPVEAQLNGAAAVAAEATRLQY